MECLVTTTQGLDDNTSIIVWNPSNGTKLLTLRGPAAQFSSLCKIKDEGFALIEVRKPFIHFWQCGYPLQTSRRILCPGKPHTLSISPDGNYFAVGIEEKLSIWQVGTGRIVTTVTSAHFHPINVIKFTSNGSWLTTGGQDGIVNSWNFLQLLSNSNLSSPNYTWSDHTLPITGIHVGSTGGQKSTIFTCSLEQTCKIYSLITGTLLLSISFPQPLTAIVVDIVESSVYLGTKSGLIYQMKLRSPPRSIDHHILSNDNVDYLFKKHSSDITTLSLSANGRILVSGDNQGNIYMWDVPSKQILRIIQQSQVSANTYLSSSSAITSTDSSKSTNSDNLKPVSNTMFWLGNPENLKGSKKPTIVFPEVPKLVESAHDR